MSTLDSGLNSIYSQNAAILTGDPDRVTVEVEDWDDEFFWKDLLCEILPNKHFHFSPFSRKHKDTSADSEIKGKSRIMQNASTFNRFHIGCVDGDYDWLLSNLTNYGQDLVNNKYLLHTYVYSIENLLCFSSALKSFCSDLTEETVTVDFCDYMKRLSEIIYPLLVWSVYLYGKGNCDFTPTAWGDVLICTNNVTKLSGLAEQDLTSEIKSVLLPQIKRLVDQKVSKLESLHAHELKDKEEFENFLCQDKGVSPDNAYLYIRGHNFYSHIVHTIIEPVVVFFKNKHYDVLKQLPPPQKTSMLNNYSSKQKPVDDLIYKNYRYKGMTEIYDKIVFDAKEIWIS